MASAHATGGAVASEKESYVLGVTGQSPKGQPQVVRLRRRPPPTRSIIGTRLEQDPGARPVPSTAVNRTRLVTMRRSAMVLSSALIDSWLSRLCRSSPIVSIWQLASRCAPRRATVSASLVVGQKLATTLPWRSSCRFIPTKPDPLASLKYP